MMVLPLAFIMGLIAVLWVFVAIALILIILIQKGKGGGLSAAFGGAGAGSLLGSKTGDFLTWVTVSLVILFLFLAVVLAKFYKPTAPTGFDSPGVTDTMPAVPTEAAPATPQIPAMVPQVPAATSKSPGETVPAIAGENADISVPTEEAETK